VRQQNTPRQKGGGCSVGAPSTMIKNRLRRCEAPMQTRRDRKEWKGAEQMERAEVRFRVRHGVHKEPPARSERSFFTNNFENNRCVSGGCMV
jgi:hypothetical protein